MEEPDASSYNCGICGDRVIGQHECWAFHKIQTQEQLAESDPSGKYAETTGSEDIVARMKLPAQYPNYS